MPRRRSENVPLHTDGAHAGYRFIAAVEVLDGPPEPAKPEASEPAGTEPSAAEEIALPPERHLSGWFSHRFFAAVGVVAVLVASAFLLRQPAAGIRPTGPEIHRVTRLAILPFRSLSSDAIDRGFRIGHGQRAHHEIEQHVRVQDVEMDEVWAYIGKKQKRVKADDDQNLGDCYTFVAIERNTKLVLNIANGKRDKATTNVFVEGVRDAIAPGIPFQVTTDGFQPYKAAIPDTFGSNVDYAMLIKVYQAAPEGERKYSPAEVSSVEVVPVMGQPDPDRICTSIIERSNLSLRMGQRRFTRLTNAFSKKWENHWAATSLWYTFYNFCRVHKSLRVTPAMAAGISDHVWDIRELLA